MVKRIIAILGVLLMVAAFIAMPAAPAPVAAVSLGTVLSPEAPVSGLGGPVLGITITTNPSKVWACTSFNVNAKVCNTGDAVANSVVITGTVTASAPQALAPQAVGDICPGYCKEYTWTNLTCDKPGPATIAITATYMSGCTPVSKTEQITIQQDCKLSVQITKPAAGTQFAVSDQFAVTALVTNNGDTDCAPVAVTLSPGANAELVGGAATYTILVFPAHESQEVNWTVHCKSIGPTDLVVHVASSCQDCAACDTKITVQQGNTCGLLITMDPPPTDKKVCICTTFNVTGKIKNTGSSPVTDVKALLTATAGAANIDQVGCTTPPTIGAWYTFAAGPIAPGAEVPVSWCVHCKGRTAPCADPDWVSFTVDAKATCLSTTVNATQAVLTNYRDQRELIVKILTPTKDTTFCCEDEFFVDVSVQNCYTGNVDGNISIAIAGNASLFPIGNPQPGTPQNWTIPQGQTRKLSDPPGPPNMWHVKCTGAGDVDITVTYSGISGTHTLCDTDKITVHQRCATSLGVTLDVPACATACQEFDVTAHITNLGVLGTNNVATNVVATLTQAGSSVTLVKGDNPATIGTITPGVTKDYTWTVRCNGGANASLSVGVTGRDEVCKKDLTANAGPVKTQQLDLGVVIISPPPCSIFHPSDTFCVTANVIDQDADTDFTSPLSATISFSNTVELVTNEIETKSISFVNGGTQQVSWTMHCKEAGDADIKVTVTGDTTGTPPCPITKSDEITVHQQTPTSLGVVIVSPFAGTCLLTCQEFAVTATVTNNGQTTSLDTAATIAFNPAAGAHAVSPTGAIPLGDMAAGATKTATWTAHCDKGVPTDIKVTATGKDAVTGLILTFTSTPVTVVQHPAASLKVDIAGNPATVNVGDNFDITSTVTNTGEADASEVALTLSVMPEGSVRVREGGYTQPVGTLAGHGLNGSQTVTWHLVCKVVSNSTITITPSGRDEFGWVCGVTPVSVPNAEILATALKPASVTVKQLGGADLGITKTVDNAFPALNSNVVYTIVVTNNGPIDASGVVVTDTLPAGLTWVSSSPTQGSDLGTGQWTVGGLVVGAKATLLLTAKVTVGTAIANTVTVKGDQPDGVIGNNTASVTINRSVSDIPLSAGWNLMSLPQIPTNGAGVKVTDINTILAGIVGQVLVVWYYDPATGWHSFSPGGPVDLATMVDGKAYFMNIKAGGATLHINNGVDILPPPSLPPEYNIVTGWNMVGFKSTTARTASDYLLAVAGKYTRIYGMVNGAYFVLQPSDNMVPGFGYWISFTANGTIYP
ncbi:MAG: DUF11 domain-containing protein [Dehalococcoidia bacterium]